MLASKTALAIRYDALGEDISTEMGVENRAKLEIRVRNLEEGKVCLFTTILDLGISDIRDHVLL